MKNTMVNQVHTEGYLYEHKIEKKVAAKTGQEFYKGTVSIATDENCSNIVTYEFIYVTPTYSKSGKENRNYKVLENIYTSGKTKTVMATGKENALKLKIDGSIGVNDFYSDKDQTIVSIVRNEASFINVVSYLNEDEKKRNVFKTDFLITGVYRKEAEPEKSLPERANIKGAVFNDFSKTLLPVTFSVYNPGAISYFEGLEASSSNPVFTQVAGSIQAQEIVSVTETEGAFGEALVEERRSTRKEYVITWAKGETYAWDDEETLTANELKEMMSKRELHLAEVKQNYDEYQKTKNAAAAPNASNAAVNVAAAGNFNF
jgi:hypothetical protein